VGKLRISLLKKTSAFILDQIGVVRDEGTATDVAHHQYGNHADTRDQYGNHFHHVMIAVEGTTENSMEADAIVITDVGMSTEEIALRSLNVN
jgi:hypothetical protein